MPLGRGMITATFADDALADPAVDDADVRRKALPRFSDENRGNNVKIVQHFRDVASKHGCTTSQLALAWLLKQGDDVIPIPGTKRVKYLEENWDSRNVKLSEEDVAEIRKFVEGAEIAGHVLPAAFENYNYADTAEET